jgi:uncharacterized linocin/CFP29 family protein
MSHLLRSFAPITDEGWRVLDEEARQRLEAALATRRLVDFAGPHGWTFAATTLGRTQAVGETPVEGVTALQRRVAPLVELRSDFSVPFGELRDADRGAVDVDLARLDEAALRIARAENIAVFHGWEKAAIPGVASSSPHRPIELGKDYGSYPSRVASAVKALLQTGVGGPYGLALGPTGYTGVVETTEHGGYPVFEHLGHILGGPIVWAPGVRGAVVLSLRGGDFLLESGQDLSIGYDHHDGQDVHLYLEESFSFRVATPEAAIGLTS